MLYFPWCYVTQCRFKVWAPHVVSLPWGESKNGIPLLRCLRRRTINLALTPNPFKRGEGTGAAWKENTRELS